MSGTVLDTGMGGVTSDTPSQGDVIAAQVVAETAQGIVTHEGTVTAAFLFSYGGATLSYQTFQQLIADAGLYAALNASTQAAAAITWNN